MKFILGFKYHVLNACRCSIMTETCSVGLTELTSVVCKFQYDIMQTG